MKIKNKEALFATVNFISVKIFSSALQSMTDIGKNSTWLFFLINASFSAVMFLIIYAFYKKGGERDIFEVLPPFFKKILGIISAFYFIISATLMLDILIRGVIRNFMIESPALFVSVFFIVPVIYGARSGIRNNVALSMIIAPVLSFAVVVGVMLLPYGDTSNFFPLLGNNDFYLKAIYGFNFFSDFYIFILMMPHLEKKEKALKTGLAGILLSFLISLIVILFTTYTIPQNAGFFSPFYYAVTFLSGSRSSVNFVKIFKLCFLLNFFLYFSTAVSFASNCLKKGFSLKYEKVLIPMLTAFILLLLRLDTGEDTINIYNGFMKYAFIIFPIIPALSYIFGKKEKVT